MTSRARFVRDRALSRLRRRATPCSGTTACAEGRVANVRRTLQATDRPVTRGRHRLQGLKSNVSATGDETLPSSVTLFLIFVKRWTSSRGEWHHEDDDDDDDEDVETRTHSVAFFRRYKLRRTRFCVPARGCFWSRGEISAVGWRPFIHRSLRHKSSVALCRTYSPSRIANGVGGNITVDRDLIT